MREYFQFALITFTSVLAIVDPIAVIPTYLVITSGETPDERARTAGRACLAAAILLSVFAASGRYIFQLFGITLPAFRIAGGFILITGIDGIRYAVRQQSVGIIHDADECRDETLVQLHGGHIVRVPCALDEVLAWFA